MTQEYNFEKPAEELASYLMMYHDTQNVYGVNPICATWFRNFISYFSTILEPNDWQSALGYTGEQGELVRCLIPEARTLIRQIVTLTTKQRLAFRCIAETQGSGVADTMRLGNGLCDQTIQDQKLDKKDEEIVEQACVMGAGFFHLRWRTDRGRPYTVADTGALQYDGDLEIRPATVWDVSYDSRITQWDERNWCDIKSKFNRFDMIAQYPELKDKILSLPSVPRNYNMSYGQSAPIDNDDIIYVYECYHKPTPALPKGRLIVYSSSDVIYYDGPNHYGFIPIVPVMPEMVFELGFGYPIFSNLLPAQEMLDHSYSAISTNQSAFAVQTVLCPRTANISAQDVNGLNFIMYDPASGGTGGEPKALQLSASAPETFKFAGILGQELEKLSNLNGAVRGAPPAGVTSGTAIATLTANALEFLSALTKANDLALEEVMNMTLQIYQKFATTPRPMDLMSKNMKYSQKTYTGKDLQGIKKIKIIRVNPLMQTLSGRIQTAESMMDKGMIKDMQAYFAILEGAPEEQLFEVELSEEDLMQSENDMMMEGKNPPVLSSDDHPAHIRKHSCLLNDPAVRNNAKYLENVTNHNLEHLRQSKIVDPMLTAMMRTGKMPEGPPPGQSQGGPPPGGGPQIPALPPQPDQGIAQPAADKLTGAR